MKMNYPKIAVLSFAIIWGVEAFSMQKSAEQFPTKLHKAVEAQDIKAIPRLLAEGLNPNVVNSSGLTALDIADQSENPEVIKAMVEHMSTKQLFEYLTLKFPDFKSYSKGGQTALHLVVGTVNAVPAKMELIDLVVQAGADINAKEKAHDEWTALHWAAAQGNLNLVEHLLTLGADPLIKDGRRNTAGGIASVLGFKEVAALLRNASKKK